MCALFKQFVLTEAVLLYCLGAEVNGAPTAPSLNLEDANSSASDVADWDSALALSYSSSSSTSCS